MPVSRWRGENYSSHLPWFSNRLDIQEPLDSGLWRFRKPVLKSWLKGFKLLEIKRFSTIHRLLCFSDGFPEKHPMTFTDQRLLRFGHVYCLHALISIIFPASGHQQWEEWNKSTKTSRFSLILMTHSKYRLNSNTFYWLRLPRFFPNSNSEKSPKSVKVRDQMLIKTPRASITSLDKK